ncbi:MAG: class I SAM-dependent methyltransferase [Bacteroidia bacterium]
MASYFTQQAKAYAGHRPSYPDELFAWIHEQMPDAQCVWDCATGNGQAAVALGTYFPQVIATDHSPAQLELAVAAKNVEYRLADAFESGLPDHSVDIITVAQALHWIFGDAFWAEAKRVLKPGGLFVAWTYAQHSFEDSQLTAITDHYHNEILKDYWPNRRKHPVNKYSEIELPFRRVESPSFDLIAEHNLEDHLGYIRSWSGTQRYINAVGEDPTDTLRNTLAPLWGEPEDRRTVRWPLTVLAGLFA